LFSLSLTDVDQAVLVGVCMVDLSSGRKEREMMAVIPYPDKLHPTLTGKS